jgi:hypothetical protein
MDLARLSRQLERDRDSNWSELQQRDNEIGRQCPHEREEERLLCWLDQVQLSDPEAVKSAAPMLTEGAIGLLATCASFVFGFLAMVGFLFAHGQGMVNVLWFFAIFILLQFLLCLVSALTLGLVVMGGSPAIINLNPARWLLSRSLPGRRHWREFQDVVQLVFLRYGQGMGVGFLLGCLTAFLLVLALNDFTFVWSSTFNVSDEVMLGAADVISAPWAQWLPLATVDAQIVADSRYYPTAGKFSSEQLRSMHSWWPLLFAAMVFYCLLPRLLLWALARYLYQRRITGTFLHYPGVDLVIRRMNQPQIRTQGNNPEGRGSVAVDVVPQEGVLVVSWSDAISVRELPLFTELTGLGGDNMVLAGLSFNQDREALSRASDAAVTLVILVVKSWEPPMADLADFIAELVRDASCLVFLRPLDGEDIPRERLDDWKRFAAEVPGGVQVKALNRTEIVRREEPADEDA